MLNLLVFTVGLPLVAAVGILLWGAVSSGLDKRVIRVRAVLVVVVLVVVAVTVLLTLGRAPSSRLALAALYPSLLVESLVEMRWDAALWPLALGLFMSLGAVVAGQQDEILLSPGEVGVALVLMATGLAALWSANPLTTIVCWALYDLVHLSALVRAGVGGKVVVSNLGLGTLAGALLWVGALWEGGGMGSVQWSLMPAGGAKMALWTVAGLLRIGPFPLHVAQPAEDSFSSPLVQASLLGPVLGWGLLVRLGALRGGVQSASNLVLVAGMLTTVGGAILAWTAASVSNSRRWISAAISGHLLVAVSFLHLGSVDVDVGSAASVLILGVFGWMLTTALLFLGGGLDVRQIVQRKALPHAVPSLVAAISLFGAPGTAGFLALSPVLASIFGAGKSERIGWVWALVFLLSHGFLVAAVMRWLLHEETRPRHEGGYPGRWPRLVVTTGLAAPLIVMGVLAGQPLLGFGVASAVTLSSLMAGPGVAGWLLWVGAVFLGGVLAWLDGRIRPRIALWTEALHDVLLLEWACDLLGGAWEQGGRMLRVIDDIVDGQGALLWACVIVLLVVLLGGL